MRMQKKQFRIGELAKKLNIERFVIRFWEKEFNITPQRSNGGQRFYREEDLQTFAQIKDLLYNNGFTIQGARQQLKKSDDSVILASQTTDIEFIQTPSVCFKEQVLELKEKLLVLRNRL
jgi:DNA-binding transcriptional MerR regulator